MKKQTIQQILIASLAVLLLCMCDPTTSNNDNWGNAEEQIITEFLEETENVSVSVEAIKMTYIYDVLHTYGPYTFFCPTNEAWDKYFAAHGLSNINDVDSLTLVNIFEYHILPIEKPTETFENGIMDEADSTINGDVLLLDLSLGLDSVIVNGSAIVEDPNHKLWNGVVHIQNEVLEPPIFTVGEYLESKDEYSSYVALLKEQGIFDTLTTKFATKYPFDRNEFTVIALTNDAMALTQKNIDSLETVDEGYSGFVAKDPTYADRFEPNQVKQFSASTILNGFNYTYTLVSDFYKSLGKVPAGDKIVRTKVVVGDNMVMVNDQTEIDLTMSNIVCKNGVVHSSNNPYMYIPDSPKEIVFSAYPNSSSRWQTKDITPKNNNNNGYLGDPSGSYGIIEMIPQELNARFTAKIPDVPAGKYSVSLIVKKQGSKCLITANEEELIFPGAESNNVYDFSYLLGNRGRVDILNPNPCSKGGLYLYEIVSTNSFTVTPEEPEVSVKFLITYLNAAQPRLAISAIILKPFAE